MCGIVGYIGENQAQPILLNCLGKLEYRGYDSCGIAVLDNEILVYKDKVRVAELARVAPVARGTAGIGHTRWATHGEPSQANAHPHCDCSGAITVVHNGIITNYLALKQKLMSEGHIFVSETDTEVIPHLIEKYNHGKLETAVRKALADIEGSYALIVLKEGEKKLVAVRQGSPLVIGIGDRAYFLASDVPAVLDYTDRVVYLEDGETAVISADSLTVSAGNKPVVKEEHKVPWTVQDAQKGGYAHFMLKEIHEQPKVMRDTLGEYIALTEPVADLYTSAGTLPKELLIVACGTSYHAALVGKYILEELMRISVRVEMASEFNYAYQPPSRVPAIAITQSGETADTLKAVKKLKELGRRVIAVTNVVGSSAARISDQTIYVRAGPEISVAATKSFTAQLMALYWLGLTYSSIDTSIRDKLLTDLRKLPGKVQQLLDSEGDIVECARYLHRYNNILYIGRGVNYPIALEGALKLKEISYIHAEGYAAGELKHGPFALLSSETPVVAVVGHDSTYEAVLTNIREIKARKSPVVALAEEEDEVIGEPADFVISIPRADALFSPVLNVVALQLLAYHIANEKGCPIDTPRNLAKSVTVE